MRKHLSTVGWVVSFVAVCVAVGYVWLVEEGDPMTSTAIMAGGFAGGGWAAAKSISWVATYLGSWLGRSDPQGKQEE